MERLIPGAMDKAFRAQTQGVYDRYVKPLATAFYITHRKIQAEPECFKREVARYQRFLSERRGVDMPYERYFFLAFLRKPVLS